MASYSHRIYTLSTLALILMSQLAAAEMTVEPSPGGAVVKIDGAVFAEYLTQPGQQPAIWPVIGPTGKAMTRSYPLGPLLEGEMDDHPHHHSIWFNHGDTNKRDFWRGNEESRQNNQIVHREFRKTESNGTTATIVTVNDWMADGKKLCEDERTVVFGDAGDARWIDFTVAIKATEGDVEFGETKEGSFGVRVNGPLTVDAKMGAHITNSRGQMDADAWGQFAEWIDDYGPVDGEVVGIAMFSHPDNFRHPTRWHARTYGLLSANPWGEREFSPDTTQPKQGATTLKKGEQLVLRYRVYLHQGDPKEAGVAEAFEAFAKQ